MTKSSSWVLCSIGESCPLKQPAPRVEPHSLRGAQLQPQRFRRFLVRQSEEVLDLDQHAPFRLRFRELFQKLVHGDCELQLGATSAKQVLHSFNRDKLRVAARNVD